MKNTWFYCLECGYIGQKENPHNACNHPKLMTLTEKNPQIDYDLFEATLSNYPIIISDKKREVLLKKLTGLDAYLVYYPETKRIGYAFYYRTIMKNTLIPLLKELNVVDIPVTILRDRTKECTIKEGETFGAIITTLKEAVYRAKKLNKLNGIISENDLSLLTNFNNCYFNSDRTVQYLKQESGNYEVIDLI